MRVITIDPGGTSGFVEANIKPTEVHLVVYQERFTPYGLLKHLQSQPDLKLIICEDFEFRPKSPTGLRMTSAHLIGVVMALSEAKSIPLRMQRAMIGKSYFKEDRILKNYGVYLPGLPHAMDAMRHFMQWFVHGSGFQYNKKQTYRVIRKLGG